MIPKVYNLPTFPITAQLFHVPGAVVSGGYTVGGARVQSPEPGGFSILEIKPALVTTEWQAPFASWLMSKGNGQIIRTRLAPTPQITKVTDNGVLWGSEERANESLWSNDQLWNGDYNLRFYRDSLAGTGTIVVDTETLGPIFKQGHVIGHMFDCYLIDEVEYDGTKAIMNIIPPLRRTIYAGDDALIRPYFTGIISNMPDVRSLYEASSVGHIQLETITMSEAII